MQLTIYRVNVIGISSFLFVMHMYNNQYHDYINYNDNLFVTIHMYEYVMYISQNSF